jgi:hypothetical protein
MRIGLINLTRNERKTCGAEVLTELADLLSKCGLTWTRTVGFFSDWTLAVNSQSNCCSRIKRGGIVEKISFCRLDCIINEEALCAKRLKVTRLIDGHLLER